MTEAASTQIWLPAGAISFALAVLLGTLALATDLPDGKVRSLARPAIAVLACLYAVYLPLKAQSLTEVPLAELPGAIRLVLLHTHDGAMWAVGMAGALAAAAAMARVGKLSMPTIAACLLPCLLAKAATGHAAELGLTSPFVWLHALHIGAGCGWAGSVCIAWLALHRRWYADAWPEAMTHRLSQFCAACLTIAAMSGIVNLWRLPGFASAGFGPYERWLAAKLIIATCAAGLGAWNRWHGVPLAARGHETARRALRATLAIELALLAAAILLAAILASTAPSM